MKLTFEGLTLPKDNWPPATPQIVKVSIDGRRIGEMVLAREDAVFLWTFVKERIPRAKELVTSFENITFSE